MKTLIPILLLLSLINPAQAQNPGPVDQCMARLKAARCLERGKRFLERLGDFEALRTHSSDCKYVRNEDGTSAEVFLAAGKVVVVQTNPAVCQIEFNDFRKNEREQFHRDGTIIAIKVIGNRLIAETASKHLFIMNEQFVFYVPLDWFYHPFDPVDSFEKESISQKLVLVLKFPNGSIRKFDLTDLEHQESTGHLYRADYEWMNWKQASTHKGLFH